MRQRWMRRPLSHDHDESVKQRGLSNLRPLFILLLGTTWYKYSAQLDAQSPPKHNSKLNVTRPSTSPHPNSPQAWGEGTFLGDRYATVTPWR